MANDTCDCTNTGNQLTDLEVAELSLQLLSEVLKRLIRVEEYAILATHLVAIPDLAVKFVDTLAKSKNNAFAYDDLKEAFGALYTIGSTLASLAGVVNPIHRWIDTAQGFYFIFKDITDPTSAIGRK